MQRPVQWDASNSQALSVPLSVFVEQGRGRISGLQLHALVSLGGRGPLVGLSSVLHLLTALPHDSEGAVLNAVLAKQAADGPRLAKAAGALEAQLVVGGVHLVAVKDLQNVPRGRRKTAQPTGPSQRGTAEVTGLVGAAHEAGDRATSGLLTARTRLT